MNRKDRRQMMANTGIMSYQRKLKRSKRFELIRENILSGKKMQDEMKEIRRIQEENNQIEMDKLSNTALNIAKEENIPFIEALSKAKEILNIN